MDLRGLDKDSFGGGEFSKQFRAGTFCIPLYSSIQLLCVETRYKVEIVPGKVDLDFTQQENIKVFAI